MTPTILTLSATVALLLLTTLTLIIVLLRKGAAQPQPPPATPTNPAQQQGDLYAILSPITTINDGVHLPAPDLATLPTVPTPQDNKELPFLPYAQPAKIASEPLELDDLALWVADDIDRNPLDWQWDIVEETGHIA